LSASLTLLDTRVEWADAQPQLVGKELAHDPRLRAGLAAAYDDPRILRAAVELRAATSAWDDDLNQLALPGHAVVSLTLSRALAGGVEIFASVENLFDAQVIVSRAGVDSLGQPRTVLAGLRLH
jgi:outer membrane receptor protein involved in Fe transport